MRFGLQVETYANLEAENAFDRMLAAFSVDTPEETLATLRAYEAAGTQYVIVKFLDAADLDPVRLFAREVMPAFDGR